MRFKTKSLEFPQKSFITMSNLKLAGTWRFWRRKGRLKNLPKPWQLKVFTALFLKTMLPLTTRISSVDRDCLHRKVILTLKWPRTLTWEKNPPKRVCRNLKLMILLILSNILIPKKIWRRWAPMRSSNWSKNKCPFLSQKKKPMTRLKRNSIEPNRCKIHSSQTRTWVQDKKVQKSKF